MQTFFNCGMFYKVIHQVAALYFPLCHDFVVVGGLMILLKVLYARDCIHCLV